MTKNPGLAALALVFAPAADNVAAGPGFQDGWGPRHAAAYGQVIHVEPIYQTFEVSVPEEYCSEGDVSETATGPGRAALAGTVVGGVLGGIVGNQFGKGNGRRVMTVAGTALGAVIGYRVGPSVTALSGDTQWDYRHCETRERNEIREEQVGYRVKYFYRGQVFHTRTDTHPGDRIRIDRRARQIHF